ncbi:response regulator [Paenibacillus cymbidii]|uniref:response regulator n=1 Tax=Paenibacillus cymbidii TaxID=1639034 RepID=UPI00108169DB|nr:response regulator [Paenibacillus cymbidii]
MLKVLIVDDDKLVRKGLIHTMPWADYDMEIVGEANHGVSALEFMNTHHVDLLITDLTMPVMSGIELMRKTRALYPHVWIVVLTFHQEFELIQEALRIGAIDYIAKVQLEIEKVEQVLERIVKRIRNDMNQNVHIGDHTIQSGAVSSNEAYVLVALHADPDLELWRGHMPTHALEDLGSGLWWVEGESEGREAANVVKARGLDDWTVFHVTDLAGADRTVLRGKLRDYKEQTFFYEYERGCVQYELPAAKWNQKPKAACSNEELLVIQKRCSSLEWAINDGDFTRLVSEIERLKPAATQLVSIFYAAMRDWTRIVSLEFLDSHESIQSFRHWADWLDWLTDIRKKLIGMLQKSYAPDIVQSVLKAVAYIHENLTQELQLPDVVRESSMSRSYFSFCFKDIIGTSFQKYVTDARLAHARVLLKQTNKPIYWVAEHCGYPNEKYFSRVFRGQTGMLPSEYRQHKE